MHQRKHRVVTIAIGVAFVCFSGSRFCRNGRPEKRHRVAICVRVIGNGLSVHHTEWRDSEREALFAAVILNYHVEPMNVCPENAPGEATAPYHFSKWKLPRWLSHPLKRSILDAALRSASAYSAVAGVTYYDKSEFNAQVVLRASFSPVQYGALDPGRCSITVYPVPSSRRHAVEQILIAHSLEALCTWLKNTQTEGNVYRGRRHEFAFAVNGSTFRVYEL